MRFIEVFLVDKVEQLQFSSKNDIIFLSYRKIHVQLFRSNDPKERVWGVAFEISRDFWDRVLEEKVESHSNSFLYNCKIGWLQRKGWIQHC